jgi:hypothetical protein
MAKFLKMLARQKLKTYLGKLELPENRSMPNTLNNSR